MHRPDRDDDPESTVLAEDLRRTIGAFVRAVRDDAGTQKSAQSETLAILDQAGDMNVAGLADRRNVKHQTMRLVVGQLEARSLVERRADPDDGRSQLYTLSTAGRAALAAERHARVVKIESMIRATLTAEERELLRASIALLARLTAA